MKKNDYTMTIDTALENIYKYVSQNERCIENPDMYGKPQKAAKTRFLYAYSHLQTIMNRIHFNHPEQIIKDEEEAKQYEAEHGKNLTKDYSVNIKPKKRYEWELVFREGGQKYYAHSAYAVCGKCGSPFMGNDKIIANPANREYGAKLFSAFCTNYGENEEVDAAYRSMILNTARDRIRDLPKYCCNCGERMENRFDDEVYAAVDAELAEARRERENAKEEQILSCSS